MALGRLRKKSTNHQDVQLASPGGDVIEAMTMGRLLRSSAARTETHCKKSDEVCCLSACALVYYGGAAWRKTDMLGVHRPSRIDAANIEYEEVRKSTADADTLVSAYLKEMEVPHAVVEAMMETPPERITVVFIDHRPTAHADVDDDVDDGPAYPASIHDWLYAKCKKESDVSWCMNSENGAPETAPAQFTWFAYLTTDQVEAMVTDWKVLRKFGTIRQEAINNELEIRELERDREHIDRMTVDELRKYARGHTTNNFGKLGRHWQKAI